MIRFDSFEILVVGAGPAGCCAAAAAARAGVPTLLIDAKSRIGELPHCGEFVPRQLLQDLQFSEDCIVQSVDSMETHVVDFSALSTSTGEPEMTSRLLDADAASLSSSHKESLKRAGTIVETKSPGFMIDRARFDRTLAREAAAAGATVLSSTRLIRCDRDCWNDYWVLKYNSEQVRTRPYFIIAADGALSTVASLTGRGRPEILTGIQIEAPLTNLQDRTFIFLHPAINGGYGWLFPKGNVANVGIGMKPGSAPHPRKVFEAFRGMIERLGLIGPGRLARSSGVIPVSGLRKSLVLGSVSFGGVVFCGDAAGLTHPITGAGIAQAAFSGHLAGVSAAAAVKTGDWKHLHNYEAEIRGRYGGPLRHAVDKRTLMVSRWKDPDFAATCKQTWIAFKEYRKRVR